MTQQDVATWVPPVQRPKRRAGRIVFWVLVGLALAVLVASIAIPVITIQPYLEQSTSMQPTLAPGDRILAVQGSSGIRRGDIVVLRVPANISGTDDLFVKRVIGLPGDRVACCDARGQVTVNGKPLSESYLYPGNPPSRTRFSVTVGKGKIWVMGDHRNISVDSRKWGPVPASGVVGRVILIGHGSSFAVVRTPRTFVADGLAPADKRLDLYAGLGIAAAASIVALLLLAVVGITRFVIRRRRGLRARRVGWQPAPAISGPLVQPLYGVYRVPAEHGGKKPPPPRAAQKPPPEPAEEKPPAVEAEEKQPPAEAEEKQPPAEAEEKQPPAEAEEKPPAAETEQIPSSPEAEERPPAAETEQIPSSPEAEERPPAAEAEQIPSSPEAEEKPPPAEAEQKPAAAEAEQKPPAAGPRSQARRRMPGAPERPAPGRPAAKRTRGRPSWPGNSTRRCRA